MTLKGRPITLGGVAGWAVSVVLLAVLYLASRGYQLPIAAQDAALSRMADRVSAVEAANARVIQVHQDEATDLAVVKAELRLVAAGQERLEAKVDRLLSRR